MRSEMIAHFTYSQVRDIVKATSQEVISMENTLFVTADKVAKDLGVSKPFAYKLVRQMNDELNKKGYLTVAGRVSRQYYEERFYGLKKEV